MIQCGRTGDGWSALATKMIMSKTNLDLNSVATFTVRELRNEELQKVSGGLKADSNEVAVEKLVGRTSCASASPAGRYSNSTPKGPKGPASPNGVATPFA